MRSTSMAIAEPTGDAHRLDAVLAAGLLEAVDEGGGDAGAGHAEGVAEGDGAAEGVELLRG